MLGMCDSLPLDLGIGKGPAILENDPGILFPQNLCELRHVPSHFKSEVFFSSEM